MKATRFHFEWSADTDPRRFRTGVSLHSHTLHSQESLDFIYKAAQYSALLRAVIRRAEARYRAHYNAALDFRRGWWTPPLAPLDAYHVEADQVRALGIAPIVSLTDHDGIEAPMSLQAVDAARHVPISVEWTVPFGSTFFHMGLHNLPARRARAIMGTLAEFTADPRRERLMEILAELHALPEVLIVLNHPLWDEKGIGGEIHRSTTLELLGQCGAFLHAIEMNGLRPWRENHQAIQLAREWSKPVISGGDRHAVEPNANLNLTDAQSFAEFAAEIRGGHSNVFVTSRYRQAYAARILHNLVDVLQPYENHGRGWRAWPDRVFYTREDGAVQSLGDIWGRDLPAVVRMFDACVRFAGKAPLRSAVRVASARAEQVVL